MRVDSEVSQRHFQVSETYTGVLLIETQQQISRSLLLKHIPSSMRWSPDADERDMHVS